jgi:hypothetical protein
MSLGSKKGVKSTCSVCLLPFKQSDVTVSHKNQTFISEKGEILDIKEICEFVMLDLYPELNGDAFLFCNTCLKTTVSFYSMKEKLERNSAAKRKKLL